MTDPIMLSVAGAVAGKTAEALTEVGKNALAALVRLIGSRLGRGGAVAPALQPALGAGPPDQAAVHELAEALERAAAADPGFAARVRELWPQARAELTAQDGGTVNINTGSVTGHLIQARDLNVQGGLHLGGWPGS
jgi:hypothetical protein